MSLEKVFINTLFLTFYYFSPFYSPVWAGERNLFLEIWLGLSYQIRKGQGLVRFWLKVHRLDTGLLGWVSSAIVGSEMKLTGLVLTVAGCVLCWAPGQPCTAGTRLSAQVSYSCFIIDTNFNLCTIHTFFGWETGQLFTAGSRLSAPVLYSCFIIDTKFNLYTNLFVDFGLRKVYWGHPFVRSCTWWSFHQL